ncbi:hypothetical protein BGW80DRAFT_1461534 [Lactifluus volemus]|nr:hypothetical protein BGW80DRAFT_1461534 [Lactifluus volemus]
MTTVTVFYLGATGYIGGAVLVDLLKSYPNLQVTELVRNPAHVEPVSELGVKVVQGSFTNSHKAELTTAILAGQKARVVEDGKPPAILYHTSGVAVFLDGTTEGKHDPNGKVWNDNDEADIRAITPQRVHGVVDDSAGSGCWLYRILYHVPRGMRGPVHGTGPSSLSPLEVRCAAPSRVNYVGEGSNLLYTLRLDDLVDLYRRVFGRILSREDATPMEGRHDRGWRLPRSSWKAERRHCGKASKVVGASQNLRGERAAALGWVPRPVALEDWVDDGIATMLARMQ